MTGDTVGGGIASTPLTELPTEMHTPWSMRAACRGLDPHVFFPATEDEAEQAKSVCGACDVRELCLDHALGHREREGVWGGCTERERRRILRRRRRAAS